MGILRFNQRGMVCEFDWDEEKNQANLEKHKISLREAMDLWDDADMVILPANRKGERRKVAFARLGSTYWTVVFVERGGLIRIISARRSTGRERAFYDKANQ